MKNNASTLSPGQYLSRSQSLAGGTSKYPVSLQIEDKTILTFREGSAGPSSPWDGLRWIATTDGAKVSYLEFIDGGDVVLYDRSPNERKPVIKIDRGLKSPYLSIKDGKLIIIHSKGSEKIPGNVCRRSIRPPTVPCQVLRTYSSTPLTTSFAIGPW